MKLRGILLGTVGFGAMFFLERQLGTVFQDMRRYDKLRAMSGDSSLLSEGLQQIGNSIMRAKRGSNGAKGDTVEPKAKARPAESGAGESLFDTLRKDVTRYAAIRAM